METYRRIAADRFNKVPNVHDAEPLIGKEEYEIIPKVTSGISSRLLELRELFDRETAQAIAFQLHNNNADRYGSKRPASAYFTKLENKLIIEWGEIDTQGDAKLHEYLTRSVDYIHEQEKEVL